MTRETPAVSKLQLSVDRARLRWAQAKIGARILRRAIGHSLEPQVYEDRDFGNYRDKGRQATRVANDAREAAAILAEAYASRVPVNVGAATHSSNGQTLSRGGIRLLLNAETWTGPRMIEGDRVDALESDEDLPAPGVVHHRQEMVVVGDGHVGLGEPVHAFLPDDVDQLV